MQVNSSFMMHIHQLSEIFINITTDLYLVHLADVTSILITFFLFEMQIQIFLNRFIK